MNLEKLLKSLIRNRYKDDLHSAILYFKSGQTIFVSANYDKSLMVILRDKNLTVDCKDITEAMSLTEIAEDELIDYEI